MLHVLSRDDVFYKVITSKSIELVNGIIYAH